MFSEGSLFCFLPSGFYSKQTKNACDRSEKEILLSLIRLDAITIQFDWAFFIEGIIYEQRRCELLCSNTC